VCFGNCTAFTWGRFRCETGDGRRAHQGFSMWAGRPHGPVNPEGGHINVGQHCGMVPSLRTRWRGPYPCRSNRGNGRGKTGHRRRQTSPSHRPGSFRQAYETGRRPKIDFRRSAWLGACPDRRRGGEFASCTFPGPMELESSSGKHLPDSGLPGRACKRPLPGGRFTAWINPDSPAVGGKTCTSAGASTALLRQKINGDN